MKATAQIRGAKDFKSKIKIQGAPGIRVDTIQGLDRIFNITRIRPRSYSFLCTANESKRLKWRNVLFEFGQRSDNDVILHLQSEFIKTKKFSKHSAPQYTFSFEDAQVNINYVSVIADVSMKCNQFEQFFFCLENRFLIVCLFTSRTICSICFELSQTTFQNDFKFSR